MAASLRRRCERERGFEAAFRWGSAPEWVLWVDLGAEGRVVVLVALIVGLRDAGRKGFSTLLVFFDRRTEGESD